LKKQNKDLRDEMKLKQDEIENMKKNTKHTKFTELETELKAMTEENVRLTAMFEEYIKTKPPIKLEDYNALEEKFYMQVNLIENLQREISRLSNDLKYLEEQNYNLQVLQIIFGI
jgi:hypothetical protein